VRSQQLNRGLFSLLALTSSLLGCSVFEEPVAGLSLEASKDADAKVPDNLAGDDAAVQTGGDGDASFETLPDADLSSDAATDSDASEPAPDAMMTTCEVPGLNLMDDCADSDIVINEIDGSGEDFVEIYNRGSSPVNVSGWVIADDSAGAPAVAEGAVIPAGTVLDPKRFLYLWSNQPPETEPNPGLFFQNCIPGAPSPCLHSEWGVSAGGERLYLLNDKLEVVCAVTYNGVYGGEALGRIPDGSSALCPTNPTAGESNVVSTLR
jgi:hypothetical protein